MVLAPQHILKLALPTLVLFYALSGDAVGGPRAYEEYFADGFLYLRLRYRAHPEAWLSRGREGRLAFTADRGRSERFPGVREHRGGRRIYRLSLPEGELRGELKPGRPGCRPELHYVLWKQGARQRSGVLRSGFCY